MLCDSSSIRQLHSCVLAWKANTSNENPDKNIRYLSEKRLRVLLLVRHLAESLTYERDYCLPGFRARAALQEELPDHEGVHHPIFID
jgi:hypothetical protein